MHLSQASGCFDDDFFNWFHKLNCARVPLN